MNFHKIFVTIKIKILCFVGVAICLLFPDGLLQEITAFLCFFASILLLIRHRKDLYCVILPENSKRCVFKLVVFITGICALLFLYALLRNTNILNCSPQQEKLLAVLVTSGLMAATGEAAPEIPYNKYIGLRLPWTIQDVPTWYYAHKVMNAVTPPIVLLYVLLVLLFPQNIKGLSICIILLWIGIPALWSYAYSHEKFKN